MLVFLPFIMASNVNPYAKGSFAGISANHTRAHLARSVYEGIAFCHRYHLEKLLATRESYPACIRLAGGAARSDVWVQMFADVMKLPVETASAGETGALGCAIAAAAATGAYDSVEDAAGHMCRISSAVYPNSDLFEIYDKKIQAVYQNYRLYGRALGRNERARKLRYAEMKKETYTLGLYEKAMPAGMGFEKMLEAARKTGFDRLEISIDESDERLSQLNWSDAQKQRLARLIYETGVPIRTMCLSGHRKYPMGSASPAVRERAMDIMRRAIDFSQAVGVSVIQLASYDVYYEKRTEKSERLFLENLIKAVEIASAQGIVLAFETMETEFMDTVGKAMKYIHAVDSSWLGIYPDVGNLQNAASLYGHSVTEDLKLGAGHVFAMHLKETRPGVYRNMRFGTGHTDYRNCLALAAKMGVRMFTESSGIRMGRIWNRS